MVGLSDVKSALQPNLPEQLATQIVDAYGSASAKYSASDYAGCLTKAGFFTEHVLRAIQFVITGAVPDEIDRISETIKMLGKAGGSESLGRLVPSILYSAVYDLRSKRGAVHFKGIDPSRRDAELCLTAMSWALSELLIEVSSADTRHLEGIVSAVLRRKSIMVEEVQGDHVVLEQLPAHLESLYIIDAHPGGIDRRRLGSLVKRSSSSVTHALNKLEHERLIHKGAASLFFITSRGERIIADDIESRHR